MRLLGWEIFRPQAQTLTLDQLIQRLDAIYETVAQIPVTPDSAMEAPTVQAIVQAVAGAISTVPVHVIRETQGSDGRTSKERLPSHPVARLLNNPAETQDRVTYWLDATSWLIRYGNHYAVKVRGVTGPIRRLEAIPPSAMSVEQLADRRLVYRVGTDPDRFKDQIHHARGPARNGWKGDSPVMDVREAIAIEIAAERFGSAFFGNGAMPGLIFNYIAGSSGHKSAAGREQFIEKFEQAYSGKRRFRALLLPFGMDVKDPIKVENDKAQFLETRRHQRSVIAGAFGVPPHMVGDLERATFSNVEHQSLEFVQRVVLRYARIFEASMERDLLTPEDRTQGVTIRFNLDGLLRGDFASRQAGQKIQREMGVINANEWRENEGLNPREGGEEYWDQGPSGQGQGAGDDPTPMPEPRPDDNGNGGRNRLAHLGRQT